MDNKINNNLKIKGVQKFTTCDLKKNPRGFEIQRRIEEIIKRPKKNWEEYRFWMKQLFQLCKLKEVFVENLVATVGRAVIAQRLAQDNTYSLNINYGAMGSNNAAPANGDTMLGTETFRKLTSSYTASSNIAYLSFFYASGDFTGAYEEFGSFVDGGAGADTGQLFSHVLISGTKTATTTLTVDADYTIS